MKVEVLYFKGCPNHQPTVERVRETLHTMGLHEDIREIEVDTHDKAEANAFLGSPSVRVNGVDVEPSARDAKVFGLTCRTYVNGSTRTGLPSRELISAAVAEQMGANPQNTSLDTNRLQSKDKTTPDRNGATALFAGGVAAILASTCCLGPLVLVSLGISGAWIGNLTVLEPYRPIFIGVALIALFFAARSIFRPAHACQPGEVCAMPRTRRVYKFMFWICAALVVVAIAYPYVARFFY
jgi:mercuric ion transport protein